MTTSDIKYYFSKKSLVFATIVLVTFASVLLYLSIKAYKANLLIATTFFLPLLIFLPFSLPRYVRFLYGALTNKPAVILTKELLIDNIHKQRYKWSDIKKVKYQPNKGKALGGYTSIILYKTDREIELPHNAIKCKTKDFLADLINYHKKYSNG